MREGHGGPGGIGVLDECLPDLAPFLMERGAVVMRMRGTPGDDEKLRELVTADPGVTSARATTARRVALRVHC